MHADVDIRTDSGLHVVFLSLGLLLGKVAAMKNTLVFRWAHFDKSHLTSLHSDKGHAQKVVHILVIHRKLVFNFPRFV